MGLSDVGKTREDTAFEECKFKQVFKISSSGCAKEMVRLIGKSFHKGSMSLGTSYFTERFGLDPTGNRKENGTGKGVFKDG